ncbi:hypothetical protein [Acidovorax delafieldii]|uniref:hypothetical protein n=1 Tax=Acidovorax delafieldii TaxID=47920 RepID=UPI003ED0356F
MSKSFDKLFWHDGNLTDVSFSVDAKGKSIVQLQALFYKDEQAPQRQPHQIRCEAVSRFQCTLDSDELKRNMFAGNISNGYLKGNTLWIYFTDGLLEVRALRFRLMKS